MRYIDKDGSEISGETQYDGEAPLEVTFSANPSNLGDYTPRYEWRFTRNGEGKPFLIRYDEETVYTFNESGSFFITLAVSFVKGEETITFETDEPFVIGISESFMEVPNAFTPNGDGINDVFRVKDGYRSIVSFKASVCNRWGKKIYEWTDIASGWDGKDSGGGEVPDGAYYLRIEAKGADGRNYKIKKVINILRGFTEGAGAVY